MSTIHRLRTPALLLDEVALSRNLSRMAVHLRGLGVPLRPHVKTSKSIEVVRRAIAGQPGGITVSTLKEAEYFLSHGIRDILYAVGIAPGKLAHVLDLITLGADLTLVLDNLAAARAVAQAAGTAGRVIPVLLEIDVDGHRSGIQPESPLLIEVARALGDGSAANLRGVMAHAGGSYGCRSPEALHATAERERAETLRAAQRLREAGWPAPVVSVGSTPTALFARNLAGVTEVRAGVYMFQDLVMAGIGVCVVADIALSVLVSVIGHQPERGWIIVDGGWMALSRDRGTSSQPVDQGYGLVRGERGEPTHDDLIVISTNQEHGIVGLRDGGIADVACYPVGTLLRILPNHACATAAQHSHYNVVAGNDASIVATWKRFGGW